MTPLGLLLVLGPVPVFWLVAALIDDGQASLLVDMWEGVKKVILFAFAGFVMMLGAIVFGIKSIRDTVVGHARTIPLKKLAADPELIEKLRQWNLDWSHPEVDDSFYVWDDEHGYMEKVTETIRRIPQSHDLFDNAGQQVNDLVSKGARFGFTCVMCRKMVTGSGFVKGTDKCNSCREAEIVTGPGRVWAQKNKGPTAEEKLANDTAFKWLRNNGDFHVDAPYCHCGRDERCYNAAWDRGYCQRQLFEDSSAAQRASFQAYVGVAPDGIWGPLTENQMADLTWKQAHYILRQRLKH